MATFALILGILSILLAFTGLGFPLGLAGITCALIARRNAGENERVATGGLVTSIVGLFLPIILLISCAAGVTGAGYCTHKALDMLQQQHYIEDDTFIQEMQRAFEQGKKEMY